MNIINGKAAANKEQLEDRKRRGCKTLELHLNLFEPQLADVDEITKRLLLSGMTTKVVHAPMNDFCNVEAFHTSAKIEVMENTLILAQELAFSQREKILVVIHQSQSFENLSNMNLLTGIVNRFSDWLSEYPNLDFALENPSMVSLEKEGMVVRNACLSGPVKLAEYLRKNLRTLRIGTVLDTCHMLNSLRIMETLGIEFTINGFFSLYSETLKLVHLSNAPNWGLLLDHGMDFQTTEDIQLFDEISRCIELFAPNAMITIETNETDMNNANRYSSVRKLIDERKSLM